MKTNQLERHDRNKRVTRYSAISALTFWAFALLFFILAPAKGHPSPRSNSTDQIAALRFQTDRLLSLNAVQNLIGIYGYYHLANMFDDPRFLNLYANGDPDLKVGVGSRGVWEGPDAAKRMLQTYVKQYKDGTAGVLSLHPVGSPVVEVAGDGQTARGLWLSIGSEASVHNSTTAFAGWVAVKYCADFKKINGEWKIWHMMTRGVFATTYDRPWTAQQPPLPPRPPSASGTDRAVADNEPLYSTSVVQKLIPEPPLPYKTWDESMSCVK